MSPLRILAACFSLLIRPFNSTGRAHRRKSGRGWSKGHWIRDSAMHIGQHSLTLATPKLHCRLMQNLLCEFVGLRALSGAAVTTRLGRGLLVAGGGGAGHKLDEYFVQGNPLVGHVGSECWVRGLGRQGQEKWNCVQCAH